MSKRKRAFLRFGRALGAASIAVLATELPNIGPYLPRSEITWPLLTALVLGLDKARRG